MSILFKNMVENYIEINNVSIVINKYNNQFKEEEYKNKELLNMIK